MAQLLEANNEKNHNFLKRKIMAFSSQVMKRLQVFLRKIKSGPVMRGRGDKKGLGVHLGI